MEFLRHLEDRGYPAEYLLARIRGRRSRLINDWRPLIYDAAPSDYLASARYQGFVRDRSPEGVWGSLLREYRWVYSQMNGQFREIFQPFFLYAELRTICICLRFLKEQKAVQVENLLENSLLSSEIAGMLSARPDVLTAVKGVEGAFLTLSEQFNGLSKDLDLDGLRGVELRLTNTYLAVIAEAGNHPLINTFFARLIDARNIMSLYKCLRFDKQTTLPIIAGGTLPETRFAVLFEKGDLFGVNALVRDISGITIETPDATTVETALYRGMTRFLKKEGREPFGAGPALDYLWNCSLEVMNLSVLMYTKDFEREAVPGELVQ